MKFIDEGVKIKVSGFNIAKSAQYRYTVYWTGDAEPFFDGFCYLLEGQTEKEFDITDVVKSHNISSVTSDYSMLYTRYTIVLMVDGVNYTNEETIANIYRYPNRKRRMETDFERIDGCPMLQGFTVEKDPYSIPVNPDDDQIQAMSEEDEGINAPIRNPINILPEQGYGGELIPHYPAVNTTKFKFDYVYFNQSIGIKRLELNNISLSLVSSNGYNVFSKSIDIASLVGRTTGKPTELRLRTTGSNVTVAKFDWNPHSRYYLKWRDRYGSFQCQPFCKTNTYSEALDKKQLLTYDLNKKIYSVDVTPTWKINSGWINQDLYPYFESIFISNYVELYDVKEDISYFVIVKDSDYTEKTVRNQGRNLFNLELTLELNKNQSILY